MAGGSLFHCRIRENESWSEAAKEFWQRQSCALHELRPSTSMANRSHQEHLKALRLPTFLREYDKVARPCAQEGVDHPRYLLRLSELELLDREQRATERRRVPAPPSQYRSIPGRFLGACLESRSRGSRPSLYPSLYSKPSRNRNHRFWDAPMASRRLVPVSVREALLMPRIRA